MEAHFLAGTIDGSPTFQAAPWYNQHGDCIVYQIADEAIVAERVDELLTVYNSAIDDRTIGFQIKGVLAIIHKLGIDGLAIESDADDRAVKSISINALLLAAYDEGPRTMGRRRGYAAAMDCPRSDRLIRADDLQPA